MSDLSQHSSLYTVTDNVRRRNAVEKRFRAYGLAAIATGVLALVVLLSTVLSNGAGAFMQTYVTLEVELAADKLDKQGNRDPEEMKSVSTFGYSPLIRNAVIARAAELGWEMPDGMNPKDMGAIISKEAAAQLRNFVLANPETVGTTITIEMLTNGRIDGYMKGRVDRQFAALDGNVSPEQLDLVDLLVEAGNLEKRFNFAFLIAPDASGQRPEAAGLGVAILGSIYMMMIVLVLALPIGVAASIYLEEFAPTNKWTDIIEVNISNLAAVPSIVFGILGLAIFINFAGLPQSAPIVGGLVRLRDLGACDFHQLCRPAAIRTHRWWLGSNADDPANDHYRNARFAEICTAKHS